MSARVLHAVTVLAVLVVAGVAAVVSFSHMAEVGRRAGEGWRALLLPLSVDGLVVAASMSLLVARRASVPGGWLPWSALLGGVVASVGANIAAAEPTTTARIVAAWPAVAFAAAFELLLQQRRVPAPVPADPTAPAAPVAEPVGQPTMPVEPVAEPAEPVVEPVVEPVERSELARVVELLATARAAGQPASQRAIARELAISRHRAGQLIAHATNSNGSGTGGPR